jgi:GNAT superfamily N-acetyltransferase
VQIERPLPAAKAQGYGSSKPPGDAHVMSLPPGYQIDRMTRAEAGILEDWAAQEGWNPGISDVDVAWAYDPGAFIAIRKDGQLTGGGSIIAYGREAGFMGLFIMRADLRRQGIGRVLWHERLRRLRARLQPGAPIGMDGVFDMAPFYEAGGFTYLHRDLRYQGTAAGHRDPAAVPLDQVAWPELAAYDARVSGIRRADFMRGWLTQPGGKGFALRQDGGVSGYGFLRPCRSGFKVGPLYAETPAVARSLLDSLLGTIPGQSVSLDVPEPNRAALRIMEELGWTQSFGCARMLNGPSMASPVAEVFGLTSFEFG